MNDLFLRSFEESRILARDNINEHKRKLEEQYFTPMRVAVLMSEMFTSGILESYKVLDPCCGVGNLAAALYERSFIKGEKSNFFLIEKSAYLYERARENFEKFGGVDLSCGDFFDFLDNEKVFDRIILNPPYAKIPSDSIIREKCISFLGYSDSNLYTSFLACCLKMLSNKGELIAIVPRSFCNGPTFKEFRKFLFKDYYINQIYLFESRKIFADSNVTQEVLIVKISRVNSCTVKISHEKSNGKVFSLITSQDRVVFSSDPHKFIHIPLADGDEKLLLKLGRFKDNLRSLGLRASTGKVVDFRSRDMLLNSASKDSAELLYQDNVRLFDRVNFSISGNKPRFIYRCFETQRNLLPRANYILVRRISFKESKLRIVAAPLMAHEIPNNYLGIENHLNYIWGERSNLGQDLCLGLYGYISTITVDQFIRRFSGHTQINAADLESLPLPSLHELESLGRLVRDFSCDAIAREAERHFFG